MEVLQEIKDDHPAILFLAVYPKELKAESWRDDCTPMFTEAVFTIAKK
jgi:hypothetical protein